MKKKDRSVKRIKLIYCLMGVMVLIMGASVFFMRYKLSSISKETEQIAQKYEKHYAMITDETEKEFWDSVYKAASLEGEERQIYVERFGSNLNHSYSKPELVQIAIDAAVDGIILEGDESQELTNVIDLAQERGIPVVTVKNDCSTSQRISFVGISSYNLGRTYGAKLLSLLTEETNKVYVLMDADIADLSQDIVVSGIQDAVNTVSLGEFDYVIEGVAIDSQDAFSSEEAIRDIFLDEKNLPDVMICLNSVFTKCAFQAAVDYNKVGKLNIIGYYDSDDILEAVSKNILQSTISIDTESMGKMSVQALQEYEKTGYVSTYMAVDSRMIGQYYARSMLEERKQEVEHEK